MYKRHPQGSAVDKIICFVAFCPYRPVEFVSYEGDCAFRLSGRAIHSGHFIIPGRFRQKQRQDPGSIPFPFPVKAERVILYLLRAQSCLIRGWGGPVHGAYGRPCVRQAVMTMAVSGQGNAENREKTSSWEKTHENGSRKKMLQNQGSWSNCPAFCLSGETFPFIVLHGQCPVPVVQWIERVSPKD